MSPPRSDRNAGEATAVIRPSARIRVGGRGIDVELRAAALPCPVDPRRQRRHRRNQPCAASTVVIEEVIRA